MPGCYEGKDDIYEDKDDIYNNLNCASGNVTIAGVNPGQVAVAGSHKNLIESLFSTNKKSRI